MEVLPLFYYEGAEIIVLQYCLRYMKHFLAKCTNEKLDMTKKIRMQAPYLEGELVGSCMFHRNITSPIQIP